MSVICLGCGQAHPAAGYCPDCERKAVRVIQMSHWPLETSLTVAALMAVEEGIRMVLPRGYPNTSPELDTELENLANVIRAHLQHVLRASPGTVAKPAPADDGPLIGVPNAPMWVDGGDDWLG